MATTIDADVVVFCGVGFMAESVKILNPNKKVLMPDLRADCAMAHMAEVERINKMREEYPDLAVVCYINSSAKLKCASDERIAFLRDYLNENGITTTIRQSRGEDILAACGMLIAKEENQ